VSRERRGSRSRSDAGGRESLRGANVRRATAADGFRPVAVRMSGWEQSSEAGGLRASPHGGEQHGNRDGKRATASRGARTTWTEQGPEDDNPRSVTGVKQTRTGLRGASRRGREKRRGRKVAGLGSPRTSGLQERACASGCGPGDPGPRADRKVRVSARRVYRKVCRERGPRREVRRGHRTRDPSCAVGE